MSSDAEGLSLTPGEREIACEHWHAVMFAPSRSALEKARLALMDAPFAIQQAVIADINDNWLREYEPEREENPFLPTVSFQDVLPVIENDNNKDTLLEPTEPFQVEPVADYTISSCSLPFPSLSSYAHRFIRGISHLYTPRLAGRMAPHNSSLHRASTHH